MIGCPDNWEEIKVTPPGERPCFDRYGFYSYPHYEYSGKKPLKKLSILDITESVIYGPFKDLPKYG